MAGVMANANLAEKAKNEDIIGGYSMAWQLHWLAMQCVAASVSRRLLKRESLMES
jgi:hypothetical protein